MSTQRKREKKKENFYDLSKCFVWYIEFCLPSNAYIYIHMLNERRYSTHNSWLYLAIRFFSNSMLTHNRITAFWGVVFFVSFFSRNSLRKANRWQKKFQEKKKKKKRFFEQNSTKCWITKEKRSQNSMLTRYSAEINPYHLNINAVPIVWFDQTFSVINMQMGENVHLNVFKARSNQNSIT